MDQNQGAARISREQITYCTLTCIKVVDGFFQPCHIFCRIEWVNRNFKVECASIFRPFLQIQ
jgi:hypothetical protein